MSEARTISTHTAPAERFDGADGREVIGRGRSMKSSLFETLQHVVVRCLRAELRGEPLSVSKRRYAVHYSPLSFGVRSLSNCA